MSRYLKIPKMFGKFLSENERNFCLRLPEGILDFFKRHYGIYAPKKFPNII